MKHQFAEILDRIPKSGIRAFFDLVLQSKGIISLGVGEPDFPTPEIIRKEAIESIEQGLTSYTSNTGMPELREAISHYLSQYFNCNYDPKTELLISAGVSQGIDITLRALLNPGDEVIIFEPCYVCYAPLITLAGGTPIAIDTCDNQFIPDINTLKSHINKNTKAIIICSPNNPTGAVIDPQTLQQIAELAISHDLWVLSDEIYAELSYQDTYTSIASLPNMKERSIVFNGFSKTYAMTGWRVGYIAGPAPLIDRALKIHQYALLCAPIMGQIAAIKALKEGPKAINPMKASYQKRRDLTINALNEIGLPTEMPGGAFYCFPDIRPTGLNSETFAMKLLQDYQVAVVPGTAFGQRDGFIRICFTTEINALKTALDKIGKFTQAYISH
ncbi:MAG: aromatic amino acid aminotransferase [Actinobacteria bacterium]|nr:aromatic amino acid aminotransferase [Actinomycetota bacterium]